MSPQLHALFLGCAVIAALLFAGFILARNPRSTPARMHAVYGAMVAWWFFCMSTIATSGVEEVSMWARAAHATIGMLPGVMFHLNAATAGLAHQHHFRIRLYYVLSVLVTMFCLFWPGLFDSPSQFNWGPYPRYTVWGVIPLILCLVTFSDVIRMYRGAVARSDTSTAYHQKARAFFRGNCISLLALADFLPGFGIAVYPLAYVVLTILHAATLFGSIRYRLIEITPEFAAEQILDTLPDGVVVVDTQGLIRLSNDSAARTFGREVTEILNRPLHEVVDAEELLATLQLPASTSRIVREVSYETDAGEHRFMRVSDTLLHDQRSEPVARLWVLHDLTAQRLAEAENDRLEGWIQHSQKLETLGVMAGGIAHDFNNLLMGMLGSADLARLRLEQGLPVDDQLRTIETAAERASELTGQMLTYAGQGPTVREPLDLNQLSRDMGELIQAAISKKATIKFHFGDPMPMIIADRSQMSQVVLNLITNAADALGDEPGNISVRTGVLDSDTLATEGSEEATRYVFLEVIDSGVGMDQETKDRMFDPFFTTKFKGRGLGLASVMGILEGHQGRIRVESEPGGGTRVTVALPAAEDVQENQAHVQPDVALNQGSGVVLVADDEPSVRRVARRMLEHAGFDVAEARDGKEAVTMFRDRAGELSLVLLDITMPEMDGWDAFSQIRSLSTDVPIVLMSGFTNVENDRRLAGNHPPFLSKPFRSAELVAKIHQALAG